MISLKVGRNSWKPDDMSNLGVRLSVLFLPSCSSTFFLARRAPRPSQPLPMLAILPQLRGTHDFNLEDDPVHRSRLDGKPAVTVPRHVIAYSMTGEFAHIRGRTTCLPLAWRSMCTLLSCTRLYDPLIRATMLILDCRHPQMNCDSCISRDQACLHWL